MQGCDTPATRRKKASHGAKPPPATGLENAGGPGRPGRSAREQRGAAIARQLAQGLRQSTALFAQQQPRRAPSVQNSPGTPALAACPVQNSPSTPEMAQFGAFSACRESFIPLWLAQHQAGRILYRMRGRVGASHDSTTRPTSAEDTRGVAGPGRGAGCGRLAGPARVRRATTTQISHIISHGHFSRPPENVAIPTTHIQCLNKLRGNYVRNYYGGGRTRPDNKETTHQATDQQPGAAGVEGAGGTRGHGRASSRRNPRRCPWAVARPQPDKFRT